MSDRGRKAELAARAAVVAAGQPARSDSDRGSAPGSGADRGLNVDRGRDADRGLGADRGRDVDRGLGADIGIGGPERPADQEKARPPRAPRTRPVRVTVELSPMEHKALRQWCAATAAELDLPVVAGAEVFRALLSLMRGNQEMAEQVRAELERTGGSRRRR